MISDPFRLYDCDVPCDGSTVVVVSHRGLRRRLPQPGRAGQRHGHRPPGPPILGSVRRPHHDGHARLGGVVVGAHRAHRRPMSTPPSSTTASAGSPWRGSRRSASAARGEGGPFVEGGTPHRSRRRAAPQHLGWPAVGRPAARLRVPARGCAAAARPGRGSPDRRRSEVAVVAAGGGPESAACCSPGECHERRARRGSSDADDLEALLLDVRSRRSPAPPALRRLRPLPSPADTRLPVLPLAAPWARRRCPGRARWPRTPSTTSRSCPASSCRSPSPSWRSTRTRPSACAPTSSTCDPRRPAHRHAGGGHLRDQRRIPRPAVRTPRGRTAWRSSRWTTSSAASPSSRSMATRWTAPNLEMDYRRVFGGQLLAQAIALATAIGRGQDA